MLLNVKIATTMKIPPAAVRDIIKRFRESGGESAGSDWRSKLDVCDLQALRRHFIKNSHGSLQDITVWVQKHFNITVWTQFTYNPQMQVKAVLCKTSSHMWTLSRNVSGPKLIYSGLREYGKPSCGLMNQNVKSWAAVPPIHISRTSAHSLQPLTACPLFTVHKDLKCHKNLKKKTWNSWTPWTPCRAD